jgi:hypothetical protein
VQHFVGENMQEHRQRRLRGVQHLMKHDLSRSLVVDDTCERSLDHKTKGDLPLWLRDPLAPDPIKNGVQVVRNARKEGLGPLQIGLRPSSVRHHVPFHGIPRSFKTATAAAGQFNGQLCCYRNSPPKASTNRSGPAGGADQGGCVALRTAVGCTGPDRKGP